MNDPFTLSDALVDALAALRPTLATFMGVPGHDDRWDDLSPEGQAEAARVFTEWRARFAALPPQTDRWRRLAAHVAMDFLDTELAALAHRDADRDLNNIASSFQNFRMAFDSMSLDDVSGWRAAASRVEAMPAALAGYRASLARGLSDGDPVAARQVRAAVTQGRVHAGEKSFVRALADRARAAGFSDAADRIDAASPAARAAWGEFCDWLEGEYLPRARVSDGVGRDRYARDARRFVGATLDLDDTYAWGWAEVRRLREAMESTAREIDPTRDVAGVLALMKTDPQRCAPDRASFLQAMRDRQAAALAALDGTHFTVPAQIREVAVREAPDGGALGAYYLPPSEDFSRPGTVWYSMSGDGPFPLWDEVSTAYHEGFPGHHLQCGTQVALRDKLSRLHRVAYGYSGFAEGWALYTESLMHELGFYESPDFYFGMLANQLMRACRVVIDIGSHLDLPIPADAVFHPGERWSFELGVEMMMAFGGMDRDYAESEVTRYLGWPAQAISYKVGQRAMLALRDDFVAKGGALKDFHQRVLETGNVSLDLLRELVLG